MNEDEEVFEFLLGSIEKKIVNADKRGAIQLIDAFRHEVRIRNDEKQSNINHLKSRINALIAKQREMDMQKEKDKKELNAMRLMSQIKYQRHSGRGFNANFPNIFKNDNNNHTVRETES